MNKHSITLGQAALVAGIGIFIMLFTAPIAEFLIYPKLVTSEKPDELVQNIIAQKTLLVTAIFAYLITFICDILVAWALYVLFIPANKSLSLLTAWFRLIHTVIALSGLLKLITIFRLLNTPNYLASFNSEHIQGQVFLLLKSFRFEWSFGMLFFALHLILLGYLAYISTYVPKILGILVVLSGVGYLIMYLGPFLYPDANLSFIMITFFGEIIFMLWLIIKGRHIQKSPLLGS